MNYRQMPTIYNPNPTLTGLKTLSMLKPKTGNNPDCIIINQKPSSIGWLFFLAPVTGSQLRANTGVEHFLSTFSLVCHTPAEILKHYPENYN
jgi:hypothetical protein